MSQKRTQDDSSSTSGYSKGNLEGVYIPDDKRHKTVPSFRSVVLEVMRQKSFQNALEPMLRRVVKEEVESAIKKHVMNLKRNLDEDLFPCESRNLQLKFKSTLSLPVFTGTRIEGEDGSAIKVVLIDAATDEIVHYAHESSAKVEIVVLEGDFDGDEGENWTIEEFKNNIVREREGKKPLLTGDVNVYLKEGSGSVGEISFTDNSSWTRSRRFRLGARVVGNSDGARIREAKTESFIVRDHRGELYKKHHPPSLTDEVWRLEKIGKDGAFHKRLTLDRVRTVKDFLILLHLDPARLRNILGSGMSAKMWEITIEHARTCVLDKRVYLYYSPMSQHKNGVVFNVVGQVIGFYSESQYIPFDKLPENEKTDAQRMATEAFQHWDGVITFEDMNSLIGMSSHTASSASTETSNANKLVASQKIGSIDYPQPSTSPDGFSPLYTLGSLNSPEDFSLSGFDALDLSHTFDIPMHVSTSLFSPSHSMTQAFQDDDHLGFMDIDCPTTSSTSMILDSQADLQSVYNGFLRSHPSSQAVRGQAYRRWRVVSSILRWLVRKTPYPQIQKYRDCRNRS